MIKPIDLKPVVVISIHYGNHTFLGFSSQTCVLLWPGGLLSLPAEMDILCNGISQLCETWWSRDLIGHEHIVPQMLGFLLHRRCIPPKATVIIL